MKKKILFAIALATPFFSMAQDGLDSDLGKKVTDVFGLIVPVVISIVLLIRFGWMGLSYAMKPEDQRNDNDTKKLMGALTQTVIGCIIAGGAVTFVQWIWPYMAN